MSCGAGTVLPAFDKSCRGDNDCVAVTHQVDCCGSRMVLGINIRDQAAFTQAERACAASYPACGCPPRPTRTEDGSITISADLDIAVACRSGACTTFLRGCGGPCAAGTSCNCCPRGPANFCVCSTTGCTSDGECRDPMHPSCYRQGIQSFCSVAGCGAPAAIR
jgi:hypothetical protein